MWFFFFKTENVRKNKFRRKLTFILSTKKASLSSSNNKLIRMNSALFFHKFSCNKTQYLTKVLSLNCTAVLLYQKGGLQLAHGLFLMIFTNAFYRLIDFCDSLRVTCVNVFRLDLRSRFESFPKFYIPITIKSKKYDSNFCTGITRF